MKKSRTILRVTAALMAILLMMTSGATALAASFKARINSSSAKVYNVPSASSKTYVQGGKGITVTVTGYSNGWARIKYKGYTGYTKVSNLNLVNRPKGYTKKSTAVYRQASTSSTRMGTLSMGSAVYVAGVSGNFYRIQNQSGSVTGYVQKGTLATQSAMMTAYKKYVAAKKAAAASSSTKKPTSSSSSSSSSSGSSSSGSSISTRDAKINAVILYAKTLIGKPYAESADPPSTFNCSAYVRHCMEKFGFDMENTAAKQAADDSHTLIKNISDLKKGDILCFDTDEDGSKVCDHTAIYLGNGTFLEASRNKKVVQQNKLDDWYKEHFLMARRPQL